MKTTTDYLHNHPALLWMLVVVFLCVALGAYWVTYSIEAENLTAMHLRSDQDKTNMLNMTLLTIVGCAVCTAAMPLFKGSGYRVFLVLLGFASSVAVAYHLAKGYQARITIARHAQLGQQADMGMADELKSINQQSKDTATAAAKVAKASSDYAPTSKYGANLLTNAGVSLRTAAAETSAATARAEQRRTLLLGQGITEAQIWGPDDWNGQRDLLPYVVFTAVLLVELFGAIGSMGFGICATELLALSAKRRKEQGTIDDHQEPIQDTATPPNVVKLHPSAGVASPSALGALAIASGGGMGAYTITNIPHTPTPPAIHAKATNTPTFGADWLTHFVPAKKTADVPAVPASTIGKTQVQQVHQEVHEEPQKEADSGTSAGTRTGTKSGTRAGTKAPQTSADMAEKGRAVGMTETEYQGIKQAVIARKVGFSVRDLKVAYSLGQDKAKYAQIRMESEGVLVKRGKGYALPHATVPIKRRA